MRGQIVLFGDSGTLPSKVLQQQGWDEGRDNMRNFDWYGGEDLLGL